MKKVEIHDGHITMGDPKLVDAQTSIGATDDGIFYRTAILCQPQRVESFDIIGTTPDGKQYHLARINVQGFGNWPSVEVFSDLEGRIEAKQHGQTLARIEPIPRPDATTTMFVFPLKDQKA